MISRYFVILLALGAAAYRFAQGAWIEATGLTGLGVGLLALKLSRARPMLRIAAYACFAATTVAIVIVLMRNYL